MLCVCAYALCARLLVHARVNAHLCTCVCERTRVYVRAHACARVRACALCVHG